MGGSGGSEAWEAWAGGSCVGEGLGRLGPVTLRPAETLITE